ncbi:hypothetical protein KCU99_g392, partial [Aureobasidium melanogenum]
LSGNLRQLRVRRVRRNVALMRNTMIARHGDRIPYTTFTSRIDAELTPEDDLSERGRNCRDVLPQSHPKRHNCGYDVVYGRTCYR